MKKAGNMAKGEKVSDSSLEGMYKEYFLDYASYVILERAVPSIEDGFKPVQRRILHAMKEMDDGRFHKVANIIGQTMQYHPHGDAAIGAALVNLGQKNLLIDCQGNWGDTRTGDSAAAARYIEARLTKFALDVVFNPQTTEWQLSYDGRKKEPIDLPVKFPMVLAQGVEGIAVGLSTKILPHNFIELIKASIKTLEGKRVKLYPDFQNGGIIDVSDYNQGKRGGRVKCRAKIEIRDKKTLAITELPYGVNTSSLIDSILKANEKGNIKIKKVIDNTAKDVEILLELHPGVSPQVSMDALFAFTNCEISIAPNACVIIDNKPHFLSVQELLKISTENTKALLLKELEIRREELLEKLHQFSLEKIFIEKRIYRDIEECESWEAVLKAIEKGLKKYLTVPGQKAVKSKIKLSRAITEEDLIRLTEIKIKRISKYNTFTHEERIKKHEAELKEVKSNIKNLTAFAIKYFEDLLKKYGKGRERKTQIAEFETIKAQRVVANNAKLYVDRKEGFIGTSLKKEEFVSECSDIDDIIAFTKAGKFKVVKLGDKVFIGKNIIHVAVWKKGDERTTYNMVYVDGKTGKSMMKRFNVKGVTRNKEYDLTKGNKGSKVHYFTSNPNGETDYVSIQLTPASSAKKKLFEIDFADIAIKGRASQGNTLTKYPIRKVTLLEKGMSSLGAMKVWIDKVTGRLNTEERGKFLGEFDTGEQLIAVYKNGTYVISDLVMEKKFDYVNLLDLGKLTEDTVLSALYFEGEKGWTMVKRFEIETTKADQEFLFISEHKSSKLYFASLDDDPIVQYTYKKDKVKKETDLFIADFVDVKGWKALGNKVGEFKILKVEEMEEVDEEEEANLKPSEQSTKASQSEVKKTPAKSKAAKKPTSKSKAKPKAKSPIKKPAAKKKGSKSSKSKGKNDLRAGDTIEFDF